MEFGHSHTQGFTWLLVAWEKVPPSHRYAINSCVALRRLTSDTSGASVKFFSLVVVATGKMGDDDDGARGNLQYLVSVCECPKMAFWQMECISTIIIIIIEIKKKQMSLLRKEEEVLIGYVLGAKKILFATQQLGVNIFPSPERKNLIAHTPCHFQFVPFCPLTSFFSA